MYATLKRTALNQGATAVEYIATADLVFSPHVREYCRQNKCGKWGKNFMCPPLVGSFTDCKARLQHYNHALLVAVTGQVNNPDNLEEYYLPAHKLHQLMLDLERKARSLGYERALALIGGDCKLCRPCLAALGHTECRHPAKARPSLEAMGVDVIASCRKVGINLEFKMHEVTWMGCLMVE